MLKRTHKTRQTLKPSSRNKMYNLINNTKRAIEDGEHKKKRRAFSKCTKRLNFKSENIYIQIESKQTRREINSTKQHTMVRKLIHLITKVLVPTPIFSFLLLCLSSLSI
jgi:hypothetical protein